MQRYKHCKVAFLRKIHQILIIGFYGSVDNLSKALIHRVTFFEGVRHFCIYFLGGMKNGPMFSFGYGPFACVGKHFALLETKVTIVRLLKRFKFTIDPGYDKYKLWVAGTIKLQPDLKIRVHSL